MGAAVVRLARTHGARFGEAERVEAVHGFGLRACVDGVELRVGSAEFLEAEGVLLPSCGEAERAERNWIAGDGRFLGWFRVADEARPEARDVVAALRKQGVEAVLLTGDRKQAAARLAGEVGILRVFAGVRPDGKREVVEALQKEGPVAMVGDGVNDAPALAQAEVGVAMGGGTDVARQASDITLIREDLRLLLRAREISRRTVRVIRQNLVLAFGYNALAIPLAAGLLEAWGGWAPGPVAASAAMALSSVSVVLNALRLRRPSSSGAR